MYGRLRRIRIENPSLGGGPSVHARIRQPHTEESDAKLPPANKLVFRSWINRRWEKRSGHDFSFTDDNPEFTILTLDIPDEQMSPEDLEMWADDEGDSASEDEADPGNNSLSSSDGNDYRANVDN